MKPCLILFGLCAAVSAHAATLRTTTTLQGPQVYLRDLFDEAGINADRVLGPGPGPGGRIIVEARQLKAIARQYSVDWQPISSADRATLQWPGRPLSREEALAAVRSALVILGAAPDCDVEIPGFNPPIVPANGSSVPIVSQLDYDREQGRFTALLAISADGMDAISVRIGGQVSDVVELPVAVARLPAGTIASSDDIRMTRLHANTVHDEVARDSASVIGMQLKRQLQPGVPIPIAELMRPSQVNRGDPVQLQLEVGALSLNGQGIALETGAAGERIRVRNISSQAVIEAVIVAPGVVRVVPGTAPITAQARGGVSGAHGG
jgi:flagella basal body P-ring formation protein FlgA